MAAMFHIAQDIHPPIPDGVSKVSLSRKISNWKELEDFLMKCFVRDPNCRPTAKELALHPWISTRALVFNSFRKLTCSPFTRVVFHTKNSRENFWNIINRNLRMQTVKLYHTSPRINLLIRTLNRKHYERVFKQSLEWTLKLF